MDGALIIDKPSGVSSHEVVKTVRKILKESSVGHLGTLDPLATGVLVLLLGKMTRLAQFYSRSDKGYEGEITFGFATDTFDSQGEPQGEVKEVNLKIEDVRAKAAALVGVRQQIPPQFSAKKVGSIPAYKLARKKIFVPLRPVTVEIKKFEISALEGSCARFVCSVSSGTYIRSIAHELGDALGCGAHLSQLRRTRLAEFDIERAVTLQDLASKVQAGEIDRWVIQPCSLLPAFHNLIVDANTALKIGNGEPVELPDASEASSMVKVFNLSNQMVTIAERVEGVKFRPRIGLWQAERRPVSNT